MLSRAGYFIRETLTSVARNAFMVLAGVLTIAVTMLLAGSGLLYSARIDNGTQRWKNGARLEVFMTVDATQSQIDAMQKTLEQSPDVKSFTFINKKQAYEDFKRIFNGQPELVNSITAESLPVSYRVAPKKAELTNELGTRFEQSDGVDTVVTPGKLLDKEVRDRNNLVRFLGVLSLVLFVVSLIIVATTIRLAIFARRREIEVMKLVGASNWFVRVPFMSEAVLQGIIGGALASGFVVFMGNVVMNTWFAKQGYLVTSADIITTVIAVMVGSMLIGLVSSIAGLWRFLSV
jgi:cell division transport system permease protein